MRFLLDGENKKWIPYLNSPINKLSIDIWFGGSISSGQAINGNKTLLLLLLSEIHTIELSKESCAAGTLWAFADDREQLDEYFCHRLTRKALASSLMS